MTDAKTSNPSLDRRQLLKAGVWAAPVVVLTAAAPAHAASTGEVPTSMIVVTSFPLTNVNEGGLNSGPLTWEGGQIRYAGNEQSPAVANIGWSEVLTGPDGEVLESRSGTEAIARYQIFSLAGESYGTAPMPLGTYTTTLTAFGSDGTVVATSSVTLTGPA